MKIKPRKINKKKRKEEENIRVQVYYDLSKSYVFTSTTCSQFPIRWILLKEGQISLIINGFSHTKTIFKDQEFNSGL